MKHPDDNRNHDFQSRYEDNRNHDFQTRYNEMIEAIAAAMIFVNQPDFEQIKLREPALMKQHVQSISGIGKAGHELLAMIIENLIREATEKAKATLATTEIAFHLDIVMREFQRSRDDLLDSLTIIEMFCDSTASPTPEQLKLAGTE